MWRSGISAACVALCLAFLSGCPNGGRVTVDFVGAPRVGFADLSVQLAANVSALPGFEVAERFRGDGPNVITVLSYFWTFGDGTVGFGRNPVHVYTAPGKYDVALTVTVSENTATGEKAVSVISEYKPEYIEVLTPNGPPVADAGATQVVTLGAGVTLDGSGSSDPDDDPLTFAWEVIEVPAGSAITTADLAGPGTVTPSFTPDVLGEYTLELTVNDGEFDDTDTVSIVVEGPGNDPPFADAGDDQTVFLDAEVALDGSGSLDPDGDPITFSWTLQSAPAGSTAALVNPATETPFLTVDALGDFVLQLIVNDGEFDSPPDTVTVTVANRLPIADAGDDQVVGLGAVVALDGTGSSDLDGQDLTFAWTVTLQPIGGKGEGTPITLDDPTSPTPTFIAGAPGAYVCTLIVNDGIADSVADTALVATDGDPPDIIFPGGEPGSNEGADIMECGGEIPLPTAEDEEEGDVTSSIEVTGTIDVHTPGVYVLVLTASDSSGNVSEPFTLTITVVDSLAPVITLVGEAAMTIECGTPFVDPGATALDQCDGVLPVQVGGDSVDTGTPGVYTITYDAVDGAGHAAEQKTRTVTIEDTLGPDITLLGDPEMTVACGVPFDDPGATALDACDGEVPVQIALQLSGDKSGQGSVVDTSIPGEHVLIYTAADRAGNEAVPRTRVVTVVDDQPPTLHLEGAADITVECGTAFATPTVTASDACEGDLTASIVVGGDTVDTGAPGDYTITFDVSDSTGLPAVQLVVVVHVVDTLAPVITLIGDPELTVECGQPYTDPGATALDQCEGDLPVTATVTRIEDEPRNKGVSGGVDTSSPADFLITYTAEDSQGLEAVPATRVVHVVDTTPPVLELIGDPEVTVECGTPFDDPGATGLDTCDGATPVHCFIDAVEVEARSNPVDTCVLNTSSPGDYVFTYVTSDNAGNIAEEITRSIHVVDTTPPVLTLNGDPEITVECGMPFDDPGATGLDTCDGATPVHCFIDAVETAARGEDVDTCILNTSSPGDFVFTYVTSDNAGNIAEEITRTVHVVDTTPPVLVLIGEPEISVECGTPYTDPGAAGSDTCDSDVPVNAEVTPITPEPTSSQLKGLGEAIVETSSSGNFLITYTAADATGNTAEPVTRIVHVIDSTPPVISLLGEPEMTVECPGPFQDPGAEALDACDDVLDAFVVSIEPEEDKLTGDDLDASAPGVFIITYGAQDGSGNAALPVTRRVVVEDTTAPVIELIGEPEATVECGAPYTDPSATATDLCDTEVLPFVLSVVPEDEGEGKGISLSLIDTSATGVWLITYAATDDSGNEAEPKTRRVEVVDTQKPVITLLDTTPMTVECGTRFVDPGAIANDECMGELDTFVVSIERIDPVVDKEFVSVVETGETATFIITYGASDGNGNDADPVTREVNVVDTQAPVISLIGEASMTAECGLPFTDPGATALDQCDGDLDAVPTYIPPSISPDARISAGIDTTLLGDWQIQYDATDSAGNAADPVFRTVTVQDTTPPEITVLGDPEITVERGSPYSDPGAEALDTCQGPVLVDASVVFLGGGAEKNGEVVIDTCVAGDYEITYTATDSNGNDADPETRLVHVVDTTPPVIALIGDDPVTVECGSSFTDPGATASDACDDVVEVITGGDVVNTNVVDTYVITYDATDAAGNAAARVTRTVNVVDTTPPVISLIGEATMTAECGSPFTDPGADALDVCEGALVVEVTIVPPSAGKASKLDLPGIDTLLLGDWTIQYDAADSAGNAAVTVTRTVTVQDTLAPVITLLGDADMTAECGSPFTDPGAEALDQCEGFVLVDSTVEPVSPPPTKGTSEGFVDTSSPGEFLITYTAIDGSGNVATPVTRTVTVVDTTPPVITMNGDSPAQAECGQPYVDAGATALDACDGVVSVSVTFTPPTVSPRTSIDGVNTFILGEWTVQYDAMDAAGNAATPVTRTVIVADTLAPVITLNGDNPVTVECGSYTDAGASALDACQFEAPVIIDASGVDPLTPGDYEVTFSSTDDAGNTANAARTVHVVDTLDPVITLIGDAVTTAECGVPFTDPGATALDQCDGSVPVDATYIPPTPPSAKGAITGIDTTILGDWTIQYDAVDSAGNAATPVFRTVTVQDTTPPEIIVFGEPEITVERGSPYTDPGAEALDTCDGALPVTTTSAPIESGNTKIAEDLIDTCVAGDYEITYTATDSNGNPAAPETRIVHVVDTTPPVITLIGDDPMTVECGSSFTDPGATVTDACDAIVELIVGGDLVDPNAVGTYVITYDATDAAGNPATQVTRTVIVEDTTPPVISLVGEASITMECNDGNFYTEPGATADDACEGDLSSSIVIAGDDVDETTPGVYTITYNVMDASGNAALEVTRTVEVVDTVPPLITLSGESLMTAECGAPFTDPGATAEDACEGPVDVVATYTPPLLAKEVVTGIDTSILGDWTIEYNATDSEGNAAIPVTRTVTVQDTLAPVITLIGEAEMTAECGSPFTDPGAEALDQCEGFVTVEATVTPFELIEKGFDPGVVDTSSVSEWTITYNAMDAQGNAATPVTRRVSVVDTTPPVITLNGDNPASAECGSLYTDAGASALDACDGIVSVTVGYIPPTVLDAKISVGVNTFMLGDWTVTYDATDAAGNAALQVTRTVTVADTTPPVITLLDNATENVECGFSFGDLGATVDDDCDSTVTLVTGGDSVLTYVPGTYVTTYDATDASGNAATQVTRTVIVEDTLAPEITVAGDNPMTIECGTAFTDPGATAQDACDTDVPVTTGGDTVLNDTPGTYVITYDATDDDGNAATQASRTVVVEDTLAPVITLIGDAEMTTECGSPFTDPGAEALDQCEGIVAVDVTVEPFSTPTKGTITTVDTSSVSEWLITYNAMDAQSNAATPVTRRVSVVDTTPPVITIIGDNPAAAECGSTYTDEGATALDACDGAVSVTVGYIPPIGDLSSRTIVGVNTNILGAWTVTYDAMDAAGNPATQATRIVNVADTLGPEITLNGSTTMNLECGDTFTDPGASAFDQCDFEAPVSLGGDTVLESTPGTYVITYDSQDSHGNNAVQQTRTVIVEDTLPPVITVDGTDPMTIECGDPFTDPGATALDACEGSVTVTVGGDTVLNDTPGTYVITYDAMDSLSQAATQETRTVVVEDTLPPVITVDGANPLTIECGDPFTDPGATALDACEGSVSVTVGGDTVLNDTPGTYVITYDAMDSLSQAATQATRTVVVEDTQAPVITLVGDDPLVIDCQGTYSDPGATALDDCDGSVTVTVGGDTVDVNTPGDYVVTYDAMDSLSQAATQVTRTVTISDNCPCVPDSPVATSIGDCPALEAFFSPAVKLAPPVGDLLYRADFECDLDSWTVAGDLWHQSRTDCSIAPVNGSTGFVYYGDGTTCTYENGGVASAGTVTSPLISLGSTLSVPVTLCFDYLLETEGADPAQDIARVEISLDGVTFVPMLSTEFESFCVDNTWHTACLTIDGYMFDNLSQFVTDIYLRFSFDTVHELQNNFLGFVVDDVRIFGFTNI